MFIVQQPMSRDEILRISEYIFGDLVKAVVDVEQGILVIDAELHADQEEMLLANGSKQENLWGINLYLNTTDISQLIEFDSMINLRPSFGNSTRGVDNPNIREKIRQIVLHWVTL